MKFNLKNDEIKYIKIVYTDNDGFTHCTKASVKRIDSKEIFACAKFEDGLYLQTPQEVSVNFVCDNGLYKASTTLKYIENDEPYTFFGIKTPELIEYEQNREYFRVKIQEDVILSFSGKAYSCKINDISANGVKLVLNTQISIPQKVKINILLTPNNIETKAKYIRTEVENGIYLASFYFIELTESDRDKISKRCIQKQLEDKRRSIS